jgi:hypothetical protein
MHLFFFRTKKPRLLRFARNDALKLVPLDHKQIDLRFEKWQKLFDAFYQKKS